MKLFFIGIAEHSVRGVTAQDFGIPAFGRSRHAWERGSSPPLLVRIHAQRRTLGPLSPMSSLRGQCCRTNDNPREPIAVHSTIRALFRSPAQNFLNCSLPLL